MLYEADTEAPKVMHTNPLPSPHDAACFRYESTTVYKAIKWVMVSPSMILAPREHILVISNIIIIFHGEGDFMSSVSITKIEPKWYVFSQIIHNYKKFYVTLKCVT